MDENIYLSHNNITGVDFLWTKSYTLATIRMLLVLISPYELAELRHANFELFVKSHTLIK